MKSNDVFPSKHLKAADLNGASPVVTIERVTLEALDKAGKEKKPVVYFVGKQKGLVCNKTNWRAIVKITGSDDSDGWIGIKIQLYVAEVEFQGDQVAALRVRAPRVAAPARPVPPPPPPPPVKEPDFGDEPGIDAEEISF